MFGTLQEFQANQDLPRMCECLLITTDKRVPVLLSVIGPKILLSPAEFDLTCLATQ